MADETTSPFDDVPDTPMVWMAHPDVANPAQFPRASVPLWRAKGWRPAEAPPPEPDPSLTVQPAPEPAAATTTTSKTAAPKGK
jgi:hypothetical protein